MAESTTGSSRFSRIWTFRWRVDVAGVPYDVRLESGWTTNTFVVERDGVELAREKLAFYAEPFRLQALEVTSDAGLIHFETAPRNWYAYGLKVGREGEEIYRSHPNPFAGLAGISRISNFGRSGKSEEEIKRLKERQKAM